MTHSRTGIDYPTTRCSGPHDLRVGAGVRCLAGPLTFLATGLLVLLYAVAWAVPPEPVHLPGLQDGADYDSLIQPLVLWLAALPESPVSVFTPIAPSHARLSLSGPTALPLSTRPRPQSRAPPIR